MTTTFLSSRLTGSEDPARPHLILVGLPGAGKSSIGRALADELGRSYLDFDAEMTRREGRTVADMFAASGEDYFRQVERSLTEELRQFGNMILAPGGGWMLDEGNLARLRPPARVVYLRVSPRVALERMGTDVASRPLLRRQDPLAELVRLYEVRDPVYMLADMFVDTEMLAPQEVTLLLADYLRAVDGA